MHLCHSKIKVCVSYHFRSTSVPRSKCKFGIRELQIHVFNVYTAWWCFGSILCKTFMSIKYFVIWGRETVRESQWIWYGHKSVVLGNAMLFDNNIMTIHVKSLELFRLSLFSDLTLQILILVAFWDSSAVAEVVWEKGNYSDLTQTFSRFYLTFWLNKTHLRSLVYIFPFTHTFGNGLASIKS